MNITGIRTWVARSQAMFMLLTEMEGQMELLKANRDLTDSTENRKQSLAIQTELDRMTRDFDKMVATFLVRMDARDRDHAYEKLIDLNVRLDMLDKFFKTYRERVATYDFIDKIDGFATPMSEQEMEEGSEEDLKADFENLGKPERADVYEMLQEAKENYEAQLALTDVIIPNKVQLIRG